MEPGKGTKRLVFQGIVKLAETMVGVIRRGKVAWVIAGSIVGAGVGSLLGMVILFWIIPGIAVGALVGATLFALAFQSPIAAPTPLTTNEELPPGPVIASWMTDFNGLPRIVVLMDRAVYTGWDRSAPWQEVTESLGQGLDPQLEDGVFISLQSLDHIAVPDGLNLPACDLCFFRGPNLQTAMAMFPSGAERDRFFALIERRFGCSLSRTGIPDGFFASTWAPLAIMVVLLILTGGAAILSDYWIANPPPPPIGKAERDSLASGLMWLAPQGVVMVSVIPLIPTVGWLFFRSMRRTMTTVLKPVRNAG